MRYSEEETLALVMFIDDIFDTLDRDEQLYCIEHAIGDQYKSFLKGYVTNPSTAYLQEALVV